MARNHAQNHLFLWAEPGIRKIPRDIAPPRRYIGFMPIYQTQNEEETSALAATLAASCKGGEVFLLHGPLGAGKASLVGEATNLRMTPGPATAIWKSPIGSSMLVVRIRFAMRSRPATSRRGLKQDTKNPPGFPKPGGLRSYLVRMSRGSSFITPMTVS